ncbi:MAG: hypothetical protein ACC726_09960 [Chloroflexota bacterium]
MHEAGTVAAALAKVVARWPDVRRAGQLELEIRDATRAEADSVAFYATALLAERGLEEVTFTVRSRGVECVLCGCLATPSPADPSCNQCGAPLPRRDGPAVVCREVA